MSELTVETINRLLELGFDSNIRQFNGAGEPFIVLPENLRAQSLASLMPPTRIKQNVVLLEVGSFCDYVNRFKNENTLIFANVTETGATFTAKLDYHGPGKPDYVCHQAAFTMTETPEWKTWMAANRKTMNQVDFATWLEDNLKLFVNPSGADLLELVRSLHGHQNARFNTALRLDNGAYSVAYDEDVVVKGTNTTRNETMALPPTFEAGIAVFQGCEAYKVTARLKTRCQDRRLVLWFETISVHEIVRESILLATKQVSEKTSIIPLVGNV